jgi:hypothetical protein
MIEKPGIRFIRSPVRIKIITENMRWGKPFVDTRDWVNYNGHLVQQGEFDSVEILYNISKIILAIFIGSVIEDFYRAKKIIPDFIVARIKSEVSEE